MSFPILSKAKNPALHSCGQTCPTFASSQPGNLSLKYRHTLHKLNTVTDNYEISITSIMKSVSLFRQEIQNRFSVSRFLHLTCLAITTLLCFRLLSYYKSTSTQDFNRITTYIQTNKGTFPSRRSHDETGHKLCVVALTL